MNIRIRNNINVQVEIRVDLQTRGRDEGWRADTIVEMSGAGQVF